MVPHAPPLPQPRRAGGHAPHTAFSSCDSPSRSPNTLHQALHSPARFLPPSPPIFAHQVGKVLAGVKVPDGEEAAFEKVLDDTGYTFFDETHNPVFERFMR